MTVLLGNGDGSFQAPAIYDTGTSSAVSVTSADFNGDGNLDLAVANSDSSNVSILLGNGDGSFRAAAYYGTGASPRSVATGDFNGDGKLDLVTANSGSNNVTVLLNTGCLP